MYLEIALGVVLGLLIYANLRGLLALSIVAMFFCVLLVLLVFGGWLLYETFTATMNLLPSLRFRGEASEIAGLVGGVFANLLLAFACGQILEKRTSLNGREAGVFGLLFYILFLGSVISLPVAITAISQGGTTSVILYFVAIVAFWVFAVRQCFLRNRVTKQ